MKNTKNIRIKREIFRGKYFWVLRDSGKILDRKPYRHNVSKNEILKHYKNYGSIDFNIYSIEKFQFTTKTVTRAEPKAKKYQKYIEYDVFVNGEKLKKSYRGISRMNTHTKDMVKSAYRSGMRHIRGDLATKGIIDYNDKVTLKAKKTYFIAWKTPKAQAKT